MRKGMVLAAGLVAALVLVAGAAGADPITELDGIRIIDGTDNSKTAGVIPDGAKNDVFGTPDVPGYYGASLEVIGNSRVTYEYVGFEAGFVNQFYDGNTLVFQNKSYNSNPVSSAGDTYTTGVLAAGTALGFEFVYNASSTNAGTVTNLGNPDDAAGSSAPNFFVVVLESDWTNDSGTTFSRGIYLALDDGGASNDDNHDDMVLRVSAVPEPGTFALIGLGILGLVLRRRRTRRA